MSVIYAVLLVLFKDALAAVLQVLLHSAMSVPWRWESRAIRQWRRDHGACSQLIKTNKHLLLCEGGQDAYLYENKRESQHLVDLCKLNSSERYCEQTRIILVDLSTSLLWQSLLLDLIKWNCYILNGMYGQVKEKLKLLALQQRAAGGLYNTDCKKDSTSTWSDDNTCYSILMGAISFKANS